MQRALLLARAGMGSTSPNPSAGCVLIKDGKVIGEGTTQPPGGPHAERVALAEAGEAARGATMYVTLEPHSHQGRTPPCTRAIIEAGVAEVHVAAIDPNPRTHGKGVAELRAAGVRVSVGEGAREAERIIEGFARWITTGLPLVQVKYAMSLDGKIATRSGDARWISGAESRQWVHALRRQVDAIMVGANTARRDDPLLTARDEAGGALPRQPLRVVVDSDASLAAGAQMLRQPGKTLVAAATDAPAAAVAGLRAAGAEVALLPRAGGGQGPAGPQISAKGKHAGGGVDLTALLRLLGQREVTNVLVEGGGELVASLLAQGLADKVHAFIAPVLIGGRDAPSPVSGAGVERLSQAVRLRDIETARYGDDMLISGYVVR
ncbi:MAG: bifunctional diaminohydroxyphosphoribosylaminopyrimidine deaminase/5-amino-6-(5-phosphoribosylamino)uracil reductase RibD [Dehalococcoidia bacterium]|nr:bifunctional diaminohydroxyphosphoribosylaminopyrimidine deaminase/5-amino-6-(5-phosphoribosylamino)uracil reductase RibD [Dehalococcoidia bacterium]